MTRGGRPFGNLERLVKTIRPSTGTSPASDRTRSMRSYNGSQWVQERGTRVAAFITATPHVFAAENDTLDARGNPPPAAHAR